MYAHAGASLTHTWTLQCTHVLVDDFSSITCEAVDSVVAKVPLVQCDWVEVSSHPLSCNSLSYFLAILMSVKAKILNCQCCIAKLYKKKKKKKLISS